MVKYPINLIDHIMFSQAQSPNFAKPKETKSVPPPSPQEFEASIQNESSHEGPVCFTEDQIYEIQPEVMQEHIDNIIEKNK